MKLAAFEVTDDVPELRDPYAIAMLTPWVNVGKVGHLVLRQIEQHLGAKKLGELTRPGDFFDFTRDRPTMRSVDGQGHLSIPNTIVNYGIDDVNSKDYIFLHMREPHARAEDYTDAMVELLQHYGVTGYCRIGSFYDAVPHTRPLLVTGLLPDEQREVVKDLVSERQNTYQGPTTIVNLVADNLEAAGTPTAILMVHVPQYAQLDEDHQASAQMLETLCTLHGFPISLVDFTRGKEQYEYISTLVQNNPQVSKVIQQLEADYDKGRTDQKPDQQGPTTKVELSPDVESFLQQMGQRLEDNQDY